MSNYIDLEPQVSAYYGTPPGQARRAGICDALRYLDSHPDQVPGRTITQSEMLTGMKAEQIVTDAKGFRIWTRILGNFGITVVPDPEPTNTEHDRDWWVENANVNDAEDCEACEGDLCPVHYGISMGIDLLARKIAALGDVPELLGLIPDPAKASEVGNGCGC